MGPRISLALLFVLNCGNARGSVDELLKEYFTPPSTSTQSSADIEKLIGTLFTAPTTLSTGTVAVSPTPAGGQSESCECVPFHRCNNTKINVVNIRVDEGSPCSYLAVCCNKQDLLATSNISPPSRTNTKECGIRNPDGIGYRIGDAQDSESQYGEFPWMVAIYYEQSTKDTQKALSYKCGGSIIHPQAILTSAHCVISKEKIFKVRAGEWDTKTTDELIPHQDRDVKSVIIHPKYYSGGFYNDVAILILQSPLELTQTIAIACLPKQGMAIEQSKCFVTGWGTDAFGQSGRNQTIMKKIELPIVPRDVCQDRLRTTWVGPKFNLHDSFICAGGEPGKGTCKGDGGSPLVCPIAGHQDKYYQAGIVAWGTDCGEQNVPEVYANAALFVDWIDQQLTDNGMDTSDYKF